MDIIIKTLIATVMADIDIFLLKTEDQTADNDKEFYTKSEIRRQLHKTMLRTVKAMDKIGFDVDKPLEIGSFNLTLKKRKLYHFPDVRKMIIKLSKNEHEN